MTPIRLALSLLVGLGVLVAAVLEVDTDVRALLGSDERVASALDTPEGRTLTLAITDPDRDKRSMLASRIAAEMASHPLVHRVTTAPKAPSSELLDWIWHNRFTLAPPTQTAFAADSLMSEMRAARDALISSSEGTLADRYLRDPTGSFRRIVATLKAASETALPTHDGISQARDDSAALMFIELQDKPFEVAAQAALDATLTELVDAGGAEALLIGPRSISAEVSNEIATRTTLTAAIATMLMVLWLACILRPSLAIMLCLLPPAIGFGAAALVVQVVFGNVHVVALGFGGALLGLALDYPLHLLAHRSGQDQSHRAQRYVAIGAATTAIAFLALLGSGISAIGQVGMFVASGLGVAAVSSIWLVNRSQIVELRSFSPVKRPFVIPHKLLVLAVFALGCAVILWQLPHQQSRGLADLAPRIIDQIKRLDRMVELPSGRYRIDVTGNALTEILARQARLAKTLQAAQNDGLIARSKMLGSFLPDRPARPELPSPAALSTMLPGLMIEAGLDPGFLGDIIAAYRAAFDVSPPGPEELAQLEQLAAIPGLIQIEGDTLRATVRLWDVAAPEHLSRMVAELGDDGIIFIDQEQSIAAGFEVLTMRVSVWLVIGAMSGLLFLLLAIRRPMDVAEIALGCVTAGLLTALLAGIPTGGIGVFHIVALTLVIGIGIDYGIFLTLSENDEQYEDAMRSVLLCAATTLIAFLTMVFSGVSLLEEIGATVCIGVIAMLGANLARRKIVPTEEKR